MPSDNLFLAQAQGESRRSTTKVCYPTTCTVRAFSFMSNHTSSAHSSPPRKHFWSQSLDMHRLRACLRGSSLLIRGLVSKLPLLPRVLRLPNFHRRVSLNERREIFGITRVKARRQLFNVLHKDTSTCCWEGLWLEPPTFFFFLLWRQSDCKLHTQRLL